MIFSVLLLVLIFYWIGRATFWRHKKYHRWLQRQLPLWEERGLINPDQGNSILNLYKLHRAGLKKKMDAVKVLTLVGSVFIGLGVIFFVASNWQRIPGHLRTAALLLVSIATLYAGYTFSFKKEGFLQVGKSLVLLATLFWGGTVALIGQIYNIPVSENWFILLIWALPIVPVAVFFENNYSHILASVLFIAWNFIYNINNQTTNYLYPVIIFLVMLTTARNLTVSRRINIIGLVIAAIFCCFNKANTLALFISTGLLAFYFFQKEERSYIYSATLSFLLWAITFFTAYPKHVNIYFIFPIGFIVYLIYKDELREGLVIALIAVIVWLNLIIASASGIFGYKFNFLGFLCLQALLGSVIYIVGIISKDKGYKFTGIYKTCGYLLSFIAFYLLSFQGILEIPYSGSNAVYFFASFFLAAIILLLPSGQFQSGYFAAKQGRLELAALLSVLLVSMVVLLIPQSLALNLMATNAILVIFAIINILMGMEIRRPGVFSLGTVVFVIFIITRFIDVGWKLKEKSLFFIVGGMVILSMGIFFEKQRKKLFERMKQGE